MKPFDIEISSIAKGPEELSYQLPINATVLKKIAGQDRPDYHIAELEKSILWIDKEKDIKKEISHIVIIAKKKAETVERSMKDVKIGIAYVVDDSLLEDAKLNFKKCEYLAVGNATAKKKWGLF